MRKIIASVSLTLVIALLALPGRDEVLGQAKKKEVAPKKEMKDKEAPAAKGGSIEVYKAKDGYRFRVKDGDDKTLAIPTKGYEEKADCLKAIAELKAILNAAKPTDSKD